jgi:hypothetical protein
MRWIWWSIGYAIMLLAVVFAMLKSRDWALANLSTAESIADWQTWRNDVEQQRTKPGPVQRRTPKSTEPPALVLMRDHFAVSMAGAVIFSSAFYWVFAWFLFGVLKGQPSPKSSDPKA